jgi:hypothetical protein
MSVVGQAQFVATVSEVITICTGLAGIYLVGAILFAAAQSHLGAIGGQPNVLADLTDRIILAVICFAVAISARSLGGAVSQIVSATTPTDAASALALWQALAGFVVNTVIYSLGASLAVGFATGAFSAQLATLAGQPHAMSSAWTRLLMVVATGVLTLVSVTLADAIIQAAF